MSLNTITKTILSIVSITSVISSIATAQLVPGPGHGGGGGGRPPQYDPCDVPSDPNCDRPGRPGRPDQPGRPPGHRPPDHGRPPNPYPGYPSDPYPGYPSNPYPSDPYPSDPYPGQSSNVVRTVGFYRNVTNQTIDLRRLAGLDRRYNGYKVVSVSASTTPNSPYRTVAQLLVDGYNYGEQINPGHEIYIRPYYTIRLGGTGNNLSLRIGGSTYINQIRIELSRY